MAKLYTSLKQKEEDFVVLMKKAEEYKSKDIIDSIHQRVNWKGKKTMSTMRDI